MIRDRGPALTQRWAVVCAARFALALGLALGLARPVHAQVEDEPAPANERAAPDSTETDLGVEGPLLDLPVERATYRLGPGDVLDVAIFGELNRHLRVTVTPEGRVIMPGMGFANVLELDINAAEARIRDVIYRNYRNVDVHVALASVRRFNVFVVGNVAQPGVRAASGVTRVAELTPRFDANGVVRRQIVIRRASGDSVRVDPARFNQLGELESNPVVHGGDVVLVPTVDERVHVFGRVAFPGTYEFLEGESLADFMRLVAGGDALPPEAADTVRLTRSTGPDQAETLLLSEAEAFGARGAALRMQPFDAIYVAGRSNFMEQELVEVTGEVVHPGTYPIEEGVTTVREAIAMAGGLTPHASLVTATLRRTPPPDPGGTASELDRMPAELLSEEERRLLEIRLRGDESNVVFDFERLLSDAERGLTQPLQSGDRIIIPRARNEVIVLGAVHSPGSVTHRPGADADYYVEQAGGYSERADKGDAVLLTAKLGTRLELDEVDAPDAGDTIIVPFKERRSFMDYVRDGAAIITPISAILLGIVAIQSAF